VHYVGVYHLVFCLFIFTIAFVIRHAKRMHHVILSSAACPALQHYLPHYLIKGTIFAKKLFNIKCMFWTSLQLLSQTYLILRRIQRDIITNLRNYSRKVPRCSCQIWMKLNFSRQIFEKCSDTKISWKSVQWEPNRSVRTDRQRRRG